MILDLRVKFETQIILKFFQCLEQITKKGKYLKLIFNASRCNLESKFEIQFHNDRELQFLDEI